MHLKGIFFNIEADRYVCYIMFMFMHLADAFIQSDLQVGQGGLA